MPNTRAEAGGIAPQNFIFWGASGHALVLADILTARGDQLLALFDNNPQQASPWPEIPIYHGQAAFAAWLAEQPLPLSIATAIGGARGLDRCQLADRFALAGLSLPSLIHPQASVSPSASIGSGCHVLAGANVGAAAHLGRCVIVNSQANVDHECVLEEGVHIAPGATLCGSIHIGAYTLIGPGAVILPRIRIGRHVIVGAGAVVSRDLPDNVVAWGNPARIIRTNSQEETP